MPISALELRNNIYRLLDKVAETGEPLAIARKGHLLKIVPADDGGKLDRLTKHDCINGDPEDLVHLDWSGEWHSDLP